MALTRDLDLYFDFVLMSVFVPLSPSGSCAAPQPLLCHRLEDQL